MGQDDAVCVDCGIVVGGDFDHGIDAQVEILRMGLVKGLVDGGSVLYMARAIFGIETALPLLWVKPRRGRFLGLRHDNFDLDSKILSRCSIKITRRRNPLKLVASSRPRKEVK